MSDAAVAEATKVEEKPAETVAVGKTKKIALDLIMATAQEVEGLTKTKALNMAELLSETVETSYFKLGGVLKVIKDNTWFEPFPDFDAFVYEKYGFQARKAHYLIQIYVDLVTKQIPWTKVSHLGWTKLKDLSPILTLENLDEWVAKAEKLTVLELQAALKAKADPEAPNKVTEDLVKLKYAVKAGQAQVIQAAVAKAKGELNTEYDAVALENICAGYVAGNSGVATQVDMTSVESMCKTAGMMPVLETLAALYPEYDIMVNKAKDVPAAAEAAEPAKA